MHCRPLPVTYGILIVPMFPTWRRGTSGRAHAFRFFGFFFLLLLKGAFVICPTLVSQITVLSYFVRLYRTSIYICVYVYVYIYICVCICIYIYMYVYVYIYIYMYVYVCLYMCMYMYIHMYVYICI